MVAGQKTPGQLIEELEAAAVEYRRVEMSREMAFIWNASQEQQSAAIDAVALAWMRRANARTALIERLEKSPCTD